MRFAGRACDPEAGHKKAKAGPSRAGLLLFDAPVKKISAFYIGSRAI